MANGELLARNTARSRRWCEEPKVQVKTLSPNDEFISATGGHWRFIGFHPGHPETVIEAMSIDGVMAAGVVDCFAANANILRIS